MDALPLVDVSPLLDATADDASRQRVGHQIDAACRETGFLRVTGHGVDPALREDLERLSREFFALPEQVKAEIAMARGGTAWRGWFPVGAELTSGRPDRKEGVYFGTELAPDDPRVVQGRPLHGPNLFPDGGLGPVVLAWTEQVTALGQAVLRGVALGLGLPEDWFVRHLTADPTVLFRVFHYPPGDDASWGVGEHTDYGLVTLLAQDHHGGLQVRSGDAWIDVPADPDVFVVNIGDMLERMTGGRYRSNPHRVLNTSGADRLSFPLFLDPSWDATVTPLPDTARDVAPDTARDVAPDTARDVAPDTARDVTPTERWDGQDLHAWDGAYGDYLTAKVAKVFPQLAEAIDVRAGR